MKTAPKRELYIVYFTGEDGTPYDNIIYAVDEDAACRATVEARGADASSCVPSLVTDHIAILEHAESMTPEAHDDEFFDAETIAIAKGEA